MQDLRKKELKALEKKEALQSHLKSMGRMKRADLRENLFSPSMK